MDGLSEFTSPANLLRWVVRSYPLKSVSGLRAQRKIKTPTSEESSATVSYGQRIIMQPRMPPENSAGRFYKGTLTH